MSKQPMTANERQKKRRAELKNNHLKPIYVRGSDGEFDERIRISSAIKELAEEKAIPSEILEMIITRAVEVIPPKDNVNKIFLTKLIKNYLDVNYE